MVGEVEIIRLKARNDWDLFARFCDRCEALAARHVLVAGDDPDPARLIDALHYDRSATKLGARARAAMAIEAIKGILRAAGRLA